MKTYTLTLALIIFSGFGFCALPGNDPNGPSEEILISVVNSFEGCTMVPAIYQELENGLNKVVDLEPMKKGSAYSIYESNQQKVEAFIEMIGVNDYIIKMTEVQDHDQCARVTTYLFVKP